MTRRAAFVLLAAGLLGAVLGLRASDPPYAVTVQRIDVTRLPEVEVYLTVTDAKGRSVLGLTDLEVSIALDDAPQRIRTLASAVTGGEALAVALLFDRSGSMKGALNQAKEAAVQFLRRLNVEDKLAVVSFDDAVRIDAGLSSDRSVLTAAIDGLGPGKDTSLYDAVGKACELLKAAPTRRQAVLVLSDGKDTKSASKIDEALALAKAQGVAVFALALGEAADMAALGKLAGETGGTVLKAGRAEELLTLYQRIADQLNNQYRLTFTSTFGGDERWHALRIRVKEAAGGSAAADREFLSSLGPGVSRALLSGAESRVEKRGLLLDAAVGAAGSLIFALLLLSVLRLVRRDLEFRPALVAAIVLVLLLLGGIIGIVFREIAP